MVAPLLVAGAGLLGAKIGSWISNNVVGADDAVKDLFDPQLSITRQQQIGNSYIAYSTGLYVIKLKVIAPSNADIVALDNYFHNFGYRVNKYEIPKMRIESREFVYMKTSNASVFSSNSQAVEQLTAMMNNGYKFFKG